MTEPLMDVLDRSPLAAALSEGDRAKVAIIASVEERAAGTTLFREGEASEAVYLVASGLVSLSMRIPGRPDATLLTLGTGELIGWSALIEDGCPCQMTTGRVSQDAVLIRLPRKPLLALCKHDHDIGFEIMRLAFLEVARRLQETRLQFLEVLTAEEAP